MRVPQWISSLSAVPMISGTLTVCPWSILTVPVAGLSAEVAVLESFICDGGASFECGSAQGTVMRLLSAAQKISHLVQQQQRVPVSGSTSCRCSRGGDMGESDTSLSLRGSTVWVLSFSQPITTQQLMIHSALCSPFRKLHSLHLLCIAETLARWPKFHLLVPDLRPFLCLIAPVR